MGVWKDFREFAMKGNVVDLAVAVVIGAAFGKVVSSLVNDIIMPPVGMLLGGVDFKNLVWRLKEPVLDPLGQVLTPAVDMRYGLFVNNLIDFLIVALTIFMVIRVMNRLMTYRQRFVFTTPVEPTKPA